MGELSKASNLPNGRKFGLFLLLIFEHNIAPTTECEQLLQEYKEVIFSCKWVVVEVKVIVNCITYFLFLE